MLEKAKNDVDAISGAMKLYLVKNGALPADGLEALVRKDAKGNSYLEFLPKDPWGRDYLLRAGERRLQFVILSRGPDGIEGTQDDVLSGPPVTRLPH